MSPFWALRIHQGDGSPICKVEQLQLTDLSPGEVVMTVEYSGVNYKDALAGTGRGQILKSFPLNGGIDAAGRVVHSTDQRFQPGQSVLVNGCGIGESVDGGYSEVLRVRGDSVVPLPPGLSLREAMVLGTAGFTAALAVHRMEQNGQNPSLGPIVVTGASGGVGGFAIQILAARGYEVLAVSGKPSARSYLKNLGAHKIVAPEELVLGERPLEKVKFGGAIDNTGGRLLGQILSHTQLWGNVAAVGLAQSAELHTTVMPFILRGVSLLGTSSNNCSRDLRHQLWNLLGGSWKPQHIESLISRTVDLHGLPEAFMDLIQRRTQGRILVEVKK